MQWPGEKLLEKLWESIADKGVGCLLKPWQMRREGVAAAEIKRLNALLEAQSEVDAAEIRAGTKVLSKDGVLSAPRIALATSIESSNSVQLNSNDVDRAVAISMTIDRRESLRKAVNSSKAVAYAEAELAQSNEPAPDGKVPDDWLFRWRDNASEVSSEELQILWGRVLAGEVKAPGSFSLRALEFLRNISEEEARLIESMAPFVTADFIVKPENGDELGTLNFHELLQLQDLGLLHGLEALEIRTNLTSVLKDKFTRGIFCQEKLILVTHADANKVIQLPIYGVTRLGVEILRLGVKSADEPYLRRVAERIKRMGFTVALGSYSKIGDGQVQPLDMVDI